MKKTKHLSIRTIISLLALAMLGNTLEASNNKEHSPSASVMSLEEINHAEYTVEDNEQLNDNRTFNENAESKLSKQLANLESLQEEFKKMQKRVKALEEDREIKEEKINLLKESNSNLEKQIETLKTETIKEMNDKIGSLEKDINTLKSDMQEIQKQLSKLATKKDIENIVVSSLKNQQSSYISFSNITAGLSLASVVALSYFRRK